MRRRALIALAPLALAALCVLVACGAFRHSIWPWIALGLACTCALGRYAAQRGRRGEDALLAGLTALAMGQLAPPLQPLLYLVAAGYVLLLPLSAAAPLCALLLGLDALSLRLPAQWPLWLAHASFATLFASLYHALLGLRLQASRRAEAVAVRKRIAEAEESARALRLVATAEGSEERARLAGVSEVEGVLRSSLEVLRAALQPHTAAVFLLAPGGESVRLRECLSQSEKIFRGPLDPREGALGAVLSSKRAVRIENARAQLNYYEGAAPAGAFCAAPLEERDGSLIGALIADREAPFDAQDERVLSSLAAEIVRAIESERVLIELRREKEEKARFFHALEELNRTTTQAQAAETAVREALRMADLTLCALTIVEKRRHVVIAAEGEGAEALRGLSFADNAGLVSNVVKLGAPLPARAMESALVFDAATALRGFQGLKVFPLRAGDSCVGTLVCGAREASALQARAQRELSLLSMQAAEALVRARLFEETARLATTDGLTGLRNRRSFNEELLARHKESQRYGRPLSLLLLDIDHFKKVNDTHGHPAGDAVLRGVAKVARDAARDIDLVARYGGEEIALILPATDARGALIIAERLRKLVEASAHASENGALKVTVSIGAATGAASVDALLESADKALYRAKRAGRNRVEGARAAEAA